MLTLSQAAKEVTASRATIQRAIKSGKLSAEKTDTGYQIDPAELFRVFDPVEMVSPAQSETVRRSGTPDKTDERAHVQALIDAAVKEATQTAEIDTLKRENAQLESLNSDLQQEREDWKEQARATQRLLEDHRNRHSQGWLERIISQFRKPD